MPSSDLNARGCSASRFTPFLLMDVPQDNALPNPYGGSEPAGLSLARAHHDRPGARSAGQSRPDAAAATQIAAFVGTAAPGDFALAGDEVIYSGPDEWSYRRMVLHQAHLAKAAGGVDAFVIGTELRGAFDACATAPPPILRRRTHRLSPPT